MAKRTFFLQFGNITKKASADDEDLLQLPQFFVRKFPDSSELQECMEEDLVFEMKDKDYGVVVQLEDFTEIYDGALVTVKFTSQLVTPTVSKSTPSVDTAPAFGHGEAQQSASAQMPSASAPANNNMIAVQEELETLKRKLATITEEKSATQKRARVDGDYVVKIHGVPMGCGPAEVKQFLHGVNILKNGLIMGLSNTGQKTGDWFAECESAAYEIRALDKSGQVLGACLIEVLESSSREILEIPPPEKSPSVPASMSSHVVKMRGLPFSAKEDAITTFFGDIPLVAIHLVKDELGRSSGDAFVELSGEDDVSKCLEKDKEHIGNRYVELYCVPMKEMLSTLHISSVPAKDDGSTCIMLQGLPYGCNDGDIARFFQEVGVTPTRIHRKISGDQAYCEFLNCEQCDRAMTRHKAYMGRRYIELFRTDYADMAHRIGLARREQQAPAVFSAGINPMSVNPFAPMIPNMMQSLPPPASIGSQSYPFRGNTNVGGGYDGGFGGGGYGVGPGGGYSGGPGGPGGGGNGNSGPSTVRMIGLPFSASRDDVAEFFRGFNFIPTSIDIQLDASGRPSGKASLDFMSSDAAAEAVDKKNKECMGERWIQLIQY